MSPDGNAIVVSTPGRVCLFGEHQDYLQLPVVPCAISLRIGITARYRQDMHVEIDLPDIGSRELFSLAGPLDYIVERDYFRSSVNVLRRSGFSFSRGLACTVHGAIPLNAGTSSSSALIVSWVGLLALLSDQRVRLSGETCAKYAHEAEVVEFGEPGGMMDHYATACGGVMSIDFQPSLRVERLKCPLGSFVLGNSGEPKDTKMVLARVKNRVLGAVGVLGECDPHFTLATATAASIHRLGASLSRDEIVLLEGTLRNRDITTEARRLMKAPVLDHRRLGQLLTDHQSVLRDVLKISTPKIDRMLDAALENGAFGGKINGSGGGGCMVAYAPEHTEQVAEAIERAGGQAFIVSPDEGMRVESDQLR